MAGRVERKEKRYNVSFKVLAHKGKHQTHNRLPHHIGTNQETILCMYGRYGNA